MDWPKTIERVEVVGGSGQEERMTRNISSRGCLWRRQGGPESEEEGGFVNWPRQVKAGHTARKPKRNRRIERMIEE